MKLEMPHLRMFAVLIGLLGYASISVADETWRFRLSPYIWFAGLKGDLSTVPAFPPAPVDISASDALNDTDASLMLLLNAKKGRHGIFADFLYTDLTSDENLIPPPINLNLRSNTRTTLFTLAYQYGLYKHDQAGVDLLAGARYWDIDANFRFKGGLGALDGEKRFNHQSWTDPVIGAKGRMRLGGTRFYAAGGALAGGFGMVSDHLYELNAVIEYQWTKAIAPAIGYRMFDVHYDRDDYLYDVRQQGWEVGLTWSF